MVPDPMVLQRVYSWGSQMSEWSALSSPISRDIAILSLRFPYCAILVRGGQRCPKYGAIHPLGT